MADELDWSRIARYVSRACSDDERRAIEARIASDAAWRDAVDAARQVWESTAPELDEWNVPAGWRELVRKEAATRTPTVVRSLRPERDAASTSPWETKRRRPAAWAAAAVVVALLGGGLWFRTHHDAAVTAGALASASMYTVATKPGQRLDLRMPDGTRVVLGVASTLRYPKSYGASRRDLYLDGEAYFEVTHDAMRPFMVHAGNAVARDIGTRFDVRAYPDEDRVDVVVAEGEVELAAGGQARATSEGRTVLAAGDFGRVDAAGLVTTRAGVDLEEYLAWTSGRLVIKNARLRDVLPQLSRWYDVEFQLADSALGNRRLTGTFEDESLPALLQFLALSLDADYAQDGRTITLTPSRNAH